MSEIMLQFRPHLQRSQPEFDSGQSQLRGFENRYTLLDGIRPIPPHPGAAKPKSPEMVNTHHAWRRLCASTGCEVTMRTFYNWISNGRLYSVRMGRQIFVPVSALETLIENCLRGENL